MTAVMPGIVLIDFCSRNKTLLDWVALLARFEDAKMIPCDAALRWAEPAIVKNCAMPGSASIFSIHLLLEGAHLFRRRAFLRDENAAGGTAVPGRKQSEWQMGEEKPKADNASEQDRNRQPRAVKEVDPAPGRTNRSRA